MIRRLIAAAAASLCTLAAHAATPWHFSAEQIAARLDKQGVVRVLATALITAFAQTVLVLPGAMG